jgi:hypothetical protein
MALAPGLRSPPTPRSDAASPRPAAFDGEQLKPYIKQLLMSTLQSVLWADAKDRERGRALIKEIGERVKERMLSACSRLLHVRACHFLITGSRRDRAAKFVRGPFFHASNEPCRQIGSKYIVLTQINENMGQGGRCVLSRYPAGEYDSDWCATARE